MCGIAGQLRFDDIRVDRPLVERMTDMLVHRGPDGAGFHFDHRIGMGHRRLALIDPEGAGQPICSEDESLWIVGNQEIYNHCELRRELDARGHTFRSDGDAEVILHRYEEIGSAAFGELTGMFAFALWDGRAEVLYLVRDPFGVKPLLYSRGSDDTLLFASELRALLQDPGVDRCLDRDSLDGYLRTLTVPEPATVFRAVRKVPAGHYVRVSASGIDLRRYFDLEIGAAPDPSGNADDPGEARLLERLHAELEATVRLSLRSDVPLGFFLSGGVDSSALIATASRIRGDRIKTYSLGFDEPSFDERPYARMVSEAFATDHCEVRLSSVDAVDIAERALLHLDEPFADSSALPTLALATRASQDVKGVLSGEGLDELFAGNAWHLPGADACLPGSTVHPPTASRPATPEELLAHPARSIFNSSSLVALYHPEYLADSKHLTHARVADDRFAAECAIHAADAMSQRLAFDLRTYLPSDMLTKMDRLPMARSLEVRVPYLNLPFANFVGGIDWTYKIRNGVQKYLMKQLMRGVLPDPILDRPKRGFAVPLDIWIWKDGPFREMVEDVLRDTRTLQRGMFNAEMVLAMLEEHARMQPFHGHRLWTLFALEMWQRHFLHAPVTTGNRANAG